MSAKIFDGNKLADKIAALLKSRVLEMTAVPKLAIVAIAPDGPSVSYINAKRARARAIGIDVQLISLQDTNQAKAAELISTLARDEHVHGIMIQLPIPANLNKAELVSLIPAEKDVDGMRFLSLEKPLFAPATVMAVMAALDDSGINPKSNKVLVVGGGEVGQPLASVFIAAGVAVKTAAKGSKNLADLVHEANIVISAVGKPNLITEPMVKPGAVIIDVGITIKNGKVYGDVDFNKVKSKAAFITPPTGGVGPMTVVMLMKNVIDAASH